jgi:hypothetical protein
MRYELCAWWSTLETAADHAAGENERAALRVAQAGLSAALCEAANGRLTAAQFEAAQAGVIAALSAYQGREVA